jgi:hypothetical protein
VLLTSHETDKLFHAQGAINAIESTLERVEKITKEANEAKEEIDQ